MIFEDVIRELRSFLRSEISINITDERYGLADGYVADFSGTLTRVDDPIEGVDAPVHYFRLGDHGLGIHQAMFKRAEWRTAPDNARELRIEVGDIVVTIMPL